MNTSHPSLEARLSYATLSEFRARLTGDVILPGDPDYDTARRVWNGMIDRRPALIARCESADDVVTAVDFAREHNLVVAVRGGGHNVAGYGTCDDGLVIDLSPMREVAVDPQKRIVRAAAGCTWGDVDRATQEYGLATPGGVVSDTGIAGLTLGGGTGWMRSKHGLSCDNLIAAELVTADGSRLTASGEENNELLWALRGGGGNFGVVTHFTYRLHPVGPEVFFCYVLHDGRDDRMAQALRTFRDYCAEAPDEVAPVAACGVVPAQEEVIPAELHGLPMVLFLAAFIGPPADGERVLAPLRRFAEPLIDFSSVMPYVAAQSALDEDYPRHTMRYYWKSVNVRSLPDEALDVIAEHARRQASPHATLDLWHMGGAVRREQGDGAAFSGREAAFIVNPEANWVEPADDEANIAWVRAALEDLQPYSDGGRYLNFPGFHEEEEEVMKTTFRGKWERLRRLKRKYDPENVFSLNQNIVP